MPASFTSGDRHEGDSVEGIASMGDCAVFAEECQSRSENNLAFSFKEIIDRRGKIAGNAIQNPVGNAILLHFDLIFQYKENRSCTKIRKN